MTFERSYLNVEEGIGICCWNASSKDGLEAMFRKAGTPVEQIIPVEEYVEASLTS